MKLLSEPKHQKGSSGLSVNTEHFVLGPTIQSKCVSDRSENEINIQLDTNVLVSRNSGRILVLTL